MLDEIMEYDEYTCDISKNMPNRISASCIKHDLSGISRALRIIARHCIYFGNLNVEDTMTVLSWWCGFDTDGKNIGDDLNEYAKLKSWLPCYIQHILEGETNEYECLEKDGASEDKLKTKQKRIEEISKQLENLEKRKGKWNSSILKCEGKKNQIFFDSIIAEAFEEGPLKTRFLICEKEPYGLICKNSKTNDKDYRKICEKAVKATAIYCILKTDTKRKVEGRWTEFSLWLNIDRSDVKDNILSWRFGKQSEPLFLIEYVDALNQNGKFCATESWMNEIHARVITKEQLDNLDTKNVFVYKDAGASKPLKRIRDKNNIQ